MVRPVLVLSFLTMASCAEEAGKGNAVSTEANFSRDPIVFDCPVGPDVDAMSKQSTATGRPVSCDDGEFTWTIDAQQEAT